MGYALGRLDSLPVQLDDSDPSTSRKGPTSTASSMSLLELLNSRWPFSAAAAADNTPKPCTRKGDSALVTTSSAAVDCAVEKDYTIRSHLEPMYAGHLMSIAVHERFRNRGVAFSLMQVLQRNFIDDYRMDSINLNCRVSPIMILCRSSLCLTTLGLFRLFAVPIVYLFFLVYHRCLTNQHCSSILRNWDTRLKG
jgi:hypothetical protein